MPLPDDAVGLPGRPAESLLLADVGNSRIKLAVVADRGLDADTARALRLALTTLACTFGSCVLLTSDNPRLKASADRHIDLDRLA